ncbi:hypothetical protein AB6Q56_11910 [Dechloromonas sp. ARDL1]|uniref:hypothetical protein n=1 Tax=Dechloromonas sp. ARDL1 TaxID=3322121 RepID=UPI003DA6E5F0
MSNKSQSAQTQIDLDSLAIDMLSLKVTQDASGVLNVNVNCHDHDFDANALSDLFEIVLETVCSIAEPVTLQ